MAAPLGVYLVYALFYALQHDVALYAIVANLRHTPFARLALALFLTPLALTLAMSWKTRERALQELLSRTV